MTPLRRRQAKQIQHTLAYRKSMLFWLMKHNEKGEKQ
jgi:hypothetical protein